MKLATSKKLPVNSGHRAGSAIRRDRRRRRSAGSRRSTRWPGRRVDALSDEVGVALLEVPAVAVVDGVVVEPLELLEPVLDAVAAAVLGDDVVPVVAVAGGVAAASPELVPVPDASAFSLIARKSTLLRSATELSWTSIEAVSASFGDSLARARPGARSNAGSPCGPARRRSATCCSARSTHAAGRSGRSARWPGRASAPKPSRRSRPPGRPRRRRTGWLARSAFISAASARSAGRIGRELRAARRDRATGTEGTRCRRAGRGHGIEGDNELELGDEVACTAVTACRGTRRGGRGRPG